MFSYLIFFVEFLLNSFVEMKANCESTITQENLNGHFKIFHLQKTNV